VPLLQRGEPERSVAVGVGVAADPEVAEIEEAYGGRGGSFHRHAVQGDVLENGGPSFRKLTGHLHHPVELHPFPLDAPVRVVEVLPPAGGIDADGLDVPGGVRADPHVLPSRWDDERPAAVGVLVGELHAVGVEVDEPPTGAATGPTLGVGRHGAQSGHGLRVSRTHRPQTLRRAQRSPGKVTTGRPCPHFGNKNGTHWRFRAIPQ
jgi:hypothetical protein